MLHINCKINSDMKIDDLVEIYKFWLQRKIAWVNYKIISKMIGDHATIFLINTNVILQLDLEAYSNYRIDLIQDVYHDMHFKNIKIGISKEFS